ncbi:MAG: WbqC family protein [Candidatus Thermoplasmatota archaeon]|nr:WbqC family protein [Candidatus Thermoplasmatota archaeon]
MILSGQQPNFLPWIGYFHKVAVSDKHVIVDSVQYNKKHVTNRNRIKTPDGPVYLTVPVLTKGKFEQNINEVKINNDEPWKKKHWKAISFFYGKAPYFKDYKDFFEETYLKKEWIFLSELNMALLEYLFGALQIRTKIHIASHENITGQKNDLIVNLTKGLDCDTYLSGRGAIKYIDEQYLMSNGVNHIFQSFKHPVYSQLWGDFTPNMSVIDLLFNTGPEAGKIIAKCSNNDAKDQSNDNEEDEMGFL